MLFLPGVLLAWGALCLSSPVPPTTCTSTSLIQETLRDVQKLTSKGRSQAMAQSKVLEAGGNVTTYLEGFIQALRSSKMRSKERKIAQKLQKIQNITKRCLGWMEQDWEPVEEEDFFSNLEYLLRFLNHYAPWEQPV